MTAANRDRKMRAARRLLERAHVLLVTACDLDRDLTRDRAGLDLAYATDHVGKSIQMIDYQLNRCPSCHLLQGHERGCKAAGR